MHLKDDKQKMLFKIGRKNAAQFWKQSLQKVSIEQCTTIFEQVPKTEISETSIEFALVMLELNKK